jgi:CBS domain-containing protein
MRYTDNTAAVLTGASLGAAMMFLLDPNRGRRRRALMRDKLVRSAHATTDALQGVSRDLGNRMTGADALTTPGDAGVRRGGMATGWPMVALAAAGAAVAARALRGNGRRHVRQANGHVVAADIMTVDPACCSPGTTLDEVAKLMRHADCGEIPIVNTAGRAIGVVTDRDIVTRVVAEGMNPVAHTAEQCMTHNPVTVRAETPLHAVIDTMERHQIRRVPVVDASGACIGMVAQADIARAAHEHSVGELVREVSEAPAS